jgi:hypothetical protein
VPRAAKTFFIHVIHNPPGAVGHMTASELSSQEGRARSRETRDNTRAHLIKKARSGAEGYMTTPELTSVRMRDSRPRGTWWRRSPPPQGSVI